MESVLEATYGQLSFSWDVDVTPTQYLPFDTQGRSAFLYSDMPTHPYLEELGINETSDFHTILVGVVVLVSTLMQHYNDLLTAPSLKSSAFKRQATSTPSWSDP